MIASLTLHKWVSFIVITAIVCSPIRLVMAFLKLISSCVLVSFRRVLVSSVVSSNSEGVSSTSVGVLVGVTVDGSLIGVVFLAWALVMAVTELVCGVSMLSIKFERIEFISFREASVFDNRNIECGFEFNALHMLAIICPLDSAASCRSACERFDWSNLLLVELFDVCVTNLLERFL